MYESVLVPLDGSPQAEKALDEAVTLVQRGGGRILLLQVVPSIEELYQTVQPNQMDVSEQTTDSLARTAYDDERIAATAYLRMVSHSVQGCGFEVETRIAEGSPVEQIIEAAGEAKANLIVLTPRGKSASSTPSKTGVFGKVADEVLRRSSGPVLVVKS